ncbi:NmrA-like protein [Macrophomina phaseolina MS6]|uniref:NmrA-like protein n=1 Tax=Macrophomina phaseolina (strain MS6) TaxID=1126212 RepID=K2SHD9_MACPH|nr:NmrA-like protein [Macrophomina phaseolina MS6]
MLILIAGITGMVGRPCAEAALARGNSVRGLGRSPEKLDKGLLQRLERFEKSKDIYDLAALDRAVTGVDAVICAYSYHPELVVEGQLLLLRAAERAGVKIFHASSWNYDWSRGQLGQHESYDPFIAFAAHVRLSSAIKPIYAFTGIIPEYFFYSERDRTWDRGSHTLHYFGDDSSKLRYCTADDLAAYSVEAVQAPGAADGGFLRVQSFTASPADVVAAYRAAHGGSRTARAQRVGSVEDAERMLAEARAVTPATEHEKYVGLSYVVHMARGTWEFEPVDCARFPGVKTTTLAEWFAAHPEL